MGANARARVLAAEREEHAPLGSVREIKGVAGLRIEVLVEVGRARKRSRDKMLGGGGASAYLPREETQAVVEAARRSSRLPIPGEPAVFLFVLSAV